MTKQILAIANCRVSSDEQLKNNSLSRQRKAVLAAAAALLLLSVGLFLLMRGVELLLMPAPVMTQKTEVSAAERLVEPPSRFLTTEERINIISRQDFCFRDFK